MTILPVYLYPHPVLRQEAARIESIDEAVKTLANDMIKTMDHIGYAVGLAAPQVGHSVQLTVLDMDVIARYAEVPHRITGKLVLINPEIISRSESSAPHDGEGCLSIPLLYSTVKRPRSLCVRYLDLEGQTQELEFDGYHAFALDHEIDHLKGILFTDHLSSLKRNMLLSKYRNLKKTFARTLTYKHVDETDTVFEGHVHDENCRH